MVLEMNILQHHYLRVLEAPGPGLVFMSRMFGTGQKGSEASFFGFFYPQSSSWGFHFVFFTSFLLDGQGPHPPLEVLGHQLRERIAIRTIMLFIAPLTGDVELLRFLPYIY